MEKGNKIYPDFSRYSSCGNIGYSEQCGKEPAHTQTHTHTFTQTSLDTHTHTSYSLKEQVTQPL